MEDLHVYVLKPGNQRDKQHLYGCKPMVQTSHLNANAGGGRASACVRFDCTAWKQPSVADGDKFALSVITRRELHEQKEVTQTS